jgi:GTP-binding protein Era
VETVSQYLPVQPAFFPADQISDRSDRFRAAEFVREQIFRTLGAELPYVSAVEILTFRKEKKLLRIEAGIWVEKQGHKGIVIGKGGERLKEMGRRARLEMEAAFGSKVFLQLWVKVREGWSQDVRTIKSLGYGE